MAEETLAAIRALITKCSIEERNALFAELRAVHQIHEFERVIGAPAEVILEAIHRAPELTRRMLRGVIADASFYEHVVPALVRSGWKDVTPEGNFSYDYKLEDQAGSVTVQVKLQRSERGQPVIKDGGRYGLNKKIFLVETQKTRGGTDAEDNRTRPYRYGEFDILAVSLQPSSGRWDRFIYTVSNWLGQGKKPDEIATMQPVSMEPDVYWTNDFNVVAKWHREARTARRIKARAKAKSRRKRN